ncbi:MAG: ABC transporter ATP-binding protein [Rubritepida sp.]|nr:ABC transporter ATP-binding protein [Rubritepida sp.]
MKALELINVVVRFGALRAVDGASLTLAAGERRAVIGPNGAGKTTLFNAITGVLPPTEGRVLINGWDATRASAQARARRGVGRTFQITNLFPELTVAENMRVALRGLTAAKWNPWARDRDAGGIAEALASARLKGVEDSPVKHLSYGAQRQLELAMALVQKPRLLLLDEPAAGLSPAERGAVADIVRALPRDIAMVLIEHDMDLALGLVDSVTVMHEGRVLLEAPPHAIRGNPRVQEVYLGRAA